MNCPDWRALTDRRDAGTLDETRWQEALGHMDDCGPCQEEALAADPTLLFRHLPTITADASQVQSMQQAVASMRRSEAVQRRRSPNSWLRAAAVAAVLLGASLLHGSAPPSTTIDSTVADAAAVDFTMTASEGGFADQTSMSADWGARPAFETAPLSLTPVAFETHASALPLVEMADPSFGSIIEVVDQDITVVVVMSENRDV